MQQRLYFLSGTLAGIIFFSSVYALAAMIDGYSHIAQTVSEIGYKGSPAQGYLQITNLIVAGCLLLFSAGLFQFADKNKLSRLPVFFMSCYAIAQIGIAAFPTPHPLHNVFGLSMTVGYMTPLVLVFAWKDQATVHNIVNISWIAFLLIAIAIALNLSPLVARDLYPLEYYGVVQRSLFVVFYGWCAYLGLKLFAKA